MTLNLKKIPLFTMFSLLIMGTSCPKEKGFYSVKYSINCKHNLKALPNFIRLDDGTSISRVEDKFCNSASTFLYTSSDNKKAYLVPLLTKEKRGCHIEIAFPTFESGLSYSVIRNEKMFNSKSFQIHSKGISALKNYLGVSSSTKGVELNENDYSVSEWCNKGKSGQGL